ncbi:apoptotic chromatin condensation inducer in the nucleus [Ochlerotatus camptorhynchus]|uniref:apoptotic chromatin condensation inducer in the nucleus n=1 Tax=Ochlerotatus camptorhynchus TaxID=644619 RepID=UPI0031DB99EA
MTRRKASEKAKSSPEKVSRRSSRRGRKSPTASPERDDASGKEQPDCQREAEEHKSDDSGSEQEEEEVRKRSRARRGTRAKASEEKTASRPRRSSRRKSQSVEPSDKEESEREENGEHAGEKDTAVMDTIPEEKPEEVQETVVAGTIEPVPLDEPKEEKTKADAEPDIVDENNHEDEDREVETEPNNQAEVEPEEQQEVERTKADICEQSRESGEVDSESVQEDESQQAPSKTEEPPKEASPEKEASEEESSSEKDNRKSESPKPKPKPVRKSRFRSRSKSPVRIETITHILEIKQNDGDDKNDDELEAGEIKDDEVPKRSPEKPTEEKPLRRPLQRKRRWLSSKTDTKASVITISTDSLKNIISEPVKPVPLSDVKLESSPEPEEIVDSNEEQAPGERRRSKDKLAIKSSEKEHIEESDYKAKPLDKLLGNRKISIVSDDGNTAIARPPSPAKHHSSNILYITNLVRPFTVLQLKSLLARTGKIVENGFWIDKIKSKCYVKYETEDEAVETRHALHGVRWPASNPKSLHVDFGTETAMEKAIISTLDDAGTTRITIDNSKDAKDFGWSRDTVKQDEVRPVREWDLGKKDTFDREDRDRGAEGDRIGRDRERERERDRDRDRERDRSGRGDEGRGDRGRRRSAEREFGRGDRERRRGSTSVSPARKFKKKENEPPIRLLDDLFRKTKTTPCIYWLPLTVEQMAAKEEQRRKDMAENQRRQEEARKQEEERRKERERRDRERRERPRSNSRDHRRRSRSRDDGRRRHR